MAKAEPSDFAALSIGPQAAEMLCAPVGTASVAAVFSSVFYMRLASGMLCATTADIDDGPISIRTSAQLDWRRVGLRKGQPVDLTRHHLRIVGLLAIDLSDAPVWQPNSVSPTFNSQDVSSALHQLRAQLKDHDGVPGLGALMIPGFQPPQNDAVFRRAAPLIASAGDWITGVVRGNSQAPADWAVSLLGAGPGLTPSGDDVLGGALLALRATGHANVAEALWRQIAPELTLRTNEISATLLAAAAMGHGSAAVHEVISALTGGAPPALDGALAAIDRIGHSSGWDTLLGVVTVLDTLAITPLNRAA